MKKRILAYTLAIIMMFFTFNTIVYAEDVMSDYLPGLIEYYQELDNPNASSGAVCNSNGVTLSAGGSVKYDFILPFDAATLDITYSASANTTLTLETPSNSYTATLSASSTTYQVTLTPEHLGVTSMTISASKALSITGLKYTKVKTDRPIISIKNDDGNFRYYNRVVEYTEYQELLKTAVIVSEKSSAIKTRNLTRYINFEDTSETTTLIDGKMYLPIGTFARAFGLYYEDYVNLMYAYISGDDFAIYLKPNDSYYESKGVNTPFTDVAVYKNGITYVPVRELAEMIGYTVYYRDGLAVIDNEIAANEILNNYDVFEELKNELAAYEPVFDEDNAGTVYHVAQTAEATDFGDGTEVEPFATIQKAADVARAGDTVIIHEGVYRESVEVKNSGTASKPIIFKAADGEDVTISAFKTVSGFTPYTNPANNISMYVTDLSDLEFESALEDAWDVDRNFVLYNDDVLVEGRHPNEKTSAEATMERNVVKRVNNEVKIEKETTTFVETPDFNPAYTSTHDHKLLPTQGDMRIRNEIAKGINAGTRATFNHTLYSEIDLNQDVEDYWKGATYIGRVGMAYNLSAGLVTASKKNEATVSESFITSIPVGSITYNEAKDEEDYGYMTHHLNTVDEEGEWYIDVETKKMYVIPPEGANPSTMEFEVKERQIAFDMRGKEYVQLHNVNTRGGGITMAECTGCVLDGGTHKYISQLDLSSAHCLQTFDTIYARYDTIDGSYRFGSDGENFIKTNLLGETGFVVSGHYNAVVNTDIEYSAAAGIDVLGSYNYVENNYVAKTGYGVTYKSGISLSPGTLDEGFPAGGHQIYQNTVTGTGRQAMGGSGAPIAPWDIAYNDLGWANTGATDSGVFYIYGTVGGTELTPTTIHHNAIHDNVTSDIGSSMTTGFYSDGHTMLCNVYNNIFYHSSDNPDYIMEDTNERYQAYEFWQEDSDGAFQRHWGNMTKTFASPDEVSFELSDYPNGYPFKAGAIRDADGRFIMNYNRSRDNYVRTLANETLNGGSYVTNDGLVALPNTNSTIRSNGVSFGEKGTKIDIYYEGDIYTKDYAALPTITFELIDSNNQTVGKIEKPLKKYAEYDDVLSRFSVYVPAIYKDCTSIILSTTARDVYFAKMVITDFDLETENAKVTIPYDADVIPMGSADHLDIYTGNESMVKGTLKTAFNVDKDLYSYLAHTHKHGARFNNRTITNTCDTISITAESSGATRNTKATVYLGTSTSGVKIAELDYSTAWSSNSSWTSKTITASLIRPLEPGTYNFYVKWSKGDSDGTSTTYSMTLY